MAKGLARYEFMENAKKIWEELGFPPLTPKKPWFGYSLGAWTPEDEDEAETAMRGEYFLTGENATNQRVKA